MSLTIALGARGRPELLQRTVEITCSNMTEADTQLVVLLDADDEKTRDMTFADKRVTKFVAPREDSLGEKFNRVLTIAPNDVYLVMVDYAPHVTKGFDRKILNAANVFPDGIGIIYNHLANLSFPQINAVTDGYVKLAGGIYPPYFPYWFVDHWLDDIGRMIDRIAFVDVGLDTHLRPGTLDYREPAFWSAVYDGLVLERRQLALKIIDAMDEPGWRKELLRGNFPLVEERSHILNQTVRQLIGRDTSTDERYERIRKKGVETLTRCIAEIEALP